MKFIIEQPSRLESANSELYKQLKSRKTKHKFADVLYTILDDNKEENFTRKGNVFYLNKEKVWFSYIKEFNKFIYAFGIGKVKVYEANKPVIVLDFPFDGKKESNSAFVQGEEVFLVYKGNYPKYVKSILDTTNDFFMIDVLDKQKTKKYWLISRLKSDNLVDYLIEFISFIAGKKSEHLKSDHPNISTTNDQIDNKIETDEDIEKIKVIHILNEIQPYLGKKKYIFTLNELSNITKNEDDINLLKKLGLLKELRANLFYFIPNTQKYYNDNRYLINKEETENMKKYKCEKCGAEFKSEVSKKLCKSCTRKSHAVNVIDELLKYIKPDEPFLKTDILNKVDNKLQYYGYIWTLEEFKLLDFDKKTNTYKLKPETVLKEFQEENQYKEEPKELFKPEKEEISQKTCSSCQKDLPIKKFYRSPDSKDGYSEKCKDCSRKSHAAIAVSDLRNYVEPNVPFLKNDLLDKVDNKMLFLDYIWTLQELDLLNYDPITDEYKLKPESELEKFQEKYGIITTETKKPSKKIVKKCPTCQKTISTSKYYKKSTTEDGYSENCKECTDKINAANILDKIQEYIKIGTPFTQQELSAKLDDSTHAASYIWTLQEHDLLEHDTKLNTYQIKINAQFEEFYNKYIHPEEKETLDKEIEESPVEVPCISEKREIIYISENFEGKKINIIMNAMINNEGLISLMEGLNSFTSNLNKCMIFKCAENYSEVMIDLEIEKEDKEESLNNLRKENWVDKTVKL